MNKKPVFAIAAALALVALFVAWRHSAPTSAGAAHGDVAKAAPLTVTLVAAQQRDVPVTIEATGTVVSLNSVDVRPQVASTVHRVAIHEGQQVKAGELLFAFDDRADRANLAKAQAQLARDRTTLADLERQWQRAQDLRAQNFIAQSAADSVQAQLDAQRATLRADEAAVQAGQVALSYNEIRSPLSGRAGAIAVYPGSLVQPSGNPLVTISQVDPIGVSFTVPEAELSALLQGTTRGADVDIVPGNAAAGAAALHGHVNFVDNAVDPATGTIRVKGSLPNADQRLWPGQFVDVRMTTRVLKAATVVPQAALILRDNQRSIYVVDAHGRAELRPVQLRYARGEMAVVDGVKPGEHVVVDGKQNLRPGAPVHAAPDGAAR